MTRLSFAHENRLKKSYISDLVKPELIISGKALVEEQIIQLHKLFLTPGFHTISVVDAQAGRHLIDIIITSLNFHHNVACLTMRQPAPYGYHNMLVALRAGGYLTDKELEDYFIDYPQADLIWFELDSALQQSVWFHLLQAKICELNIHIQIPIITFIYRCQ